GERTAACFGAARLPDLIFALHQNRQQLLFDVAAAVPALVDDHRILVAEFANFFFELPQTWLVHRANMNVADAAIGKFVNFLPPLFHPALVSQRCVRGGVDGFDARLPGAFFSWFAVEGDFDFAIETIVEQLPIFIAGLDLLAADRDQVIASLHFYPVFIG